MPRFWIVSSNVDSKYNLAQWSEIILNEHAVFMGYGAGDSSGDKFINDVQRGDIVLIARGANWQKELLACGKVASGAIYKANSNLNISLYYDSYRKLDPFMQLEPNEISFDPTKRNLTWEAITSGQSKNPHRAIAKLNPTEPIRKLDKIICDFLLRKVTKAERKMQMDSLKYLIEKTGQIILQGPPGTGKTWRAKNLAAFMLGLDLDKEDWQKDLNKVTFQKGGNGIGAWAIVQFHPSYNYEDFVRGIQVKTVEDSGQLEYLTDNRIFGQMAAMKDGDKKYVLIIDEINRANVAAVLGELIYALEYREEPVETPYAVKSGDENGKESNTLIVPTNLYIIGTMNTADRSIGHIDYAVRRRFAFVSCPPKEEVIDGYYADTKIKDKALKLFQAVKGLFDSHLSPDFHKDDVQVGHTYFLVKGDSSDEMAKKLALKFSYQVYPLLREYYKDGVFKESDTLTVDIDGSVSFDVKKYQNSEEMFNTIWDFCKQ